MATENVRDQVRYVTTPRRGEVMAIVAPKYSIDLIVVRPGEVFVTASGLSFLLKNGIGVAFVLPNLAIYKSFEEEVDQVEKTHPSRSI